MPFDAIAVKQHKLVTVTGEDSTVTVQPDVNVAAGSTLMFFGSAYQQSTGETVLLNSCADTSSNTWGGLVNTRSAGQYTPNGMFARAENVAGGVRPTLTLTVNKSSSVTLSGCLVEIEKVPTSAVMDGALRTGLGSSAMTVSTSASGTLAQTDNLLLIGGAGWIDLPYATTGQGYTELVAVHNGSGPGYVGFWLGWKKVTATTSVTGIVSFTNTTSDSVAMMAIAKAASAGTLRARFAGFNPAVVTSSMTGITARLRRVSMTNPETVITGLAGSATAGEITITSGLPASTASGETMYGQFETSDRWTGWTSCVVDSI